MLLCFEGCCAELMSLRFFAASSFKGVSDEVSSIDISRAQTQNEHQHIAITVYKFSLSPNIIKIVFCFQMCFYHQRHEAHFSVLPFVLLHEEGCNRNDFDIGERAKNNRENKI